MNINKRFELQTELNTCCDLNRRETLITLIDELDQALINKKNMAGKLATDTVLFGECSRYAMYAVHTRFENVMWFISDAETPNEDGLPTVIAQENTFSATLSKIG